MSQTGVPEFLSGFNTEIANSRAVIDKKTRSQCALKGVELKPGDKDRLAEFAKEVDRYRGRLPVDPQDEWNTRLQLADVPVEEVYDVRQGGFQYKFEGDGVKIKIGEIVVTYDQRQLLEARLASVLNAEVLNPNDPESRLKAEWIVWPISRHKQGKVVGKSMLVLKPGQEKSFVEALKTKFA